MILERLHIRKRYNDSDYDATVEFSSEHGKIELILSESLSKEIFKVCADALTEHSRNAAEAMMATIIEAQTKELPSPDKETDDV